MADTANTAPAADQESTTPDPAEGPPAPADGTSAEGTKPEAEAKPNDGETPPWGDDFDAERAWRLIQNLRQEKDALKARKDDPEKLSAAEQRAKEAERALYLERAFRKYPELDADDFRDFLTGETEEEILAKAERLARLGKPKEEAPASDPAPTPNKPTPSLVPGHGGEERPAFDPVAIAKAARR